jgi:hypothetical protein
MEEEEEEKVGNKFKERSFSVGWLMEGLLYDALVHMTVHSSKYYNDR